MLADRIQAARLSPTLGDDLDATASFNAANHAYWYYRVTSLTTTVTGDCRDMAVAFLRRPVYGQSDAAATELDRIATPANRTRCASVALARSGSLAVMLVAQWA